MTTPTPCPRCAEHPPCACDRAAPTTHLVARCLRAADAAKEEE